MTTVNLSNVAAPAGAKRVKFRSKHALLTLWRRQTKEIRNHHGELLSREDGYSYQFTDGVLVVFEGQDVLPDGYDTESGKVVEQDVIGWLRNHPDLNSPDVGGFHEEGREPDRPLPTDAEVISEITEAASALDGEALEAVIAREEATHKRELLLTAARQALEVVRAADGQEPPKGGSEGDGAEGTGENGGGDRAAELDAMPRQEFVEYAKGLGVKAVGVKKKDAIAAVIAAEAEKG